MYDDELKEALDDLDTIIDCLYKEEKRLDWAMRNTEKLYYMFKTNKDSGKVREAIDKYMEDDKRYDSMA